MYEKAFALEIITPGKVVFKDEATSLSAPGVLGGFQILFNHAPFLSELAVGELKVKDTEGKDTVFATGGGFVEAKNNRVVVLADSVELASEIDVDRARAAKDRAEARLHSQDVDIDHQRAEAALARAVNRLRLSRKA